jgi:hypothetical protein
MIVRHPLKGRRRIFPSSRHSLSFFNFNLNRMVGSGSGIEILRSPWFQLTYSSLCDRSLRMTSKGLLPNTEAIVKNLNLTPMVEDRNDVKEMSPPYHPDFLMSYSCEQLQKFRKLKRLQL